MRLAVFILIFLTFGCATNTKNNIVQGSFSLNGGSLNSQTWVDSLEFERKSWFNEITLILDVYSVKIDSKSPFFKWFSSSNQKEITKLKDFKLMLIYTLDSDKISKKDFDEELLANGYQVMNLPEFEKHFKFHSQFVENSFKLYKVLGYYSENGNKFGQLKINFPGFKAVILK